jgi:hypothetical protein
VCKQLRVRAIHASRVDGRADVEVEGNGAQEVRVAKVHLDRRTTYLESAPPVYDNDNNDNNNNNNNNTNTSNNKHASVHRTQVVLALVQLLSFYLS